MYVSEEVPGSGYRMTELLVQTAAPVGRTAESEPADDVALLNRFIAEQSDRAFAELMQRHGPMVLGVCRRILRNSQDAEDAYQATFLLLVQKSRAIRRPEQLANWLFGVAYRVSVRIKARAARRGNADMGLIDAIVDSSAVDAGHEANRAELRLVLDEELHRLPEKYRIPLILCYLQGKTHVEAAEVLGCPSGTMSSRLAQARDRLRGRLAKRGLVFSAAVLAATLAEETYAETLPAVLLESTARAAVLTAAGKAEVADVVSSRVAEVVADFQRWMVWSHLQKCLVLVCVLVLVAIGVDQTSAAFGDSLSSRLWSQVRPVPASSGALSVMTSAGASQQLMGLTAAGSGSTSGTGEAATACGLTPCSSSSR